jgi:DNA-binding CsgD family transcriptional regulator
MTEKQDRTNRPNTPKGMDDGGPQFEELDIGRPSPERTRAANEVGSAIVHQLNGPLTALRLYVGEIRQNSRRVQEGAETQAGMHQMVESAFQETERVCAMMRIIADSFEGPFYRETAVALGRDVISWWSRNGDANGRDPEQAASIHELLTPRERQVLGHISQGCSNKQGAIRMQIGPRTFESHRARIMRKLGARNGADLVRIALGDHSVTS